MYCEKCGTVSEENAKFCAGCGRSFSSDKEISGTPGKAPEVCEDAWTQELFPVDGEETGAQKGKDSREKKEKDVFAPFGTGKFAGTLLLLLIPAVNFVLLFIWSFGGKVNINLRNFARAYLLVSLSLITLALILVTAALLCGYEPAWTEPLKALFSQSAA